jgi:UDP-glucose 4-epimerase
MNVLVTGGAGYIGSTIVSALEDAGHVAVILDNLSTGSAAFTNNKKFFAADIADLSSLRQIQDRFGIDCAIHCAARVVVPESVADPVLYYRENVSKSLEFFHNLIQLGITRVVFSSSASIYGFSEDLCVREDSLLAPQSPYARTKYMMEMMLEDVCNTGGLHGLALRYFNPIGSDPLLRTGVHVAQPSHVLGRLVDTALGKLPEFAITGVNYPTRDGSGLRDYVHVWDLAQAHVRAIEQFDSALQKANSNYGVINLGTGQGTTVKELVAAFEQVWGTTIAKREAPARAGDVAGAYASAERAFDWLGWRTERTLEDGIYTALEWGKKRKQVLGYS